MEKLLKIGNAKRPLSIRLPLVAFILSLTVAFVVSYASYIETIHLVEANNKAYLVEKNRQMITVIDTIYQEAYDHLTFISLFPSLKKIVEKRETIPNEDIHVEKKRIEKLFKNFLMTKKIYTEVELLDLRKQRVLISVKKEKTDKKFNKKANIIAAKSTQYAIAQPLGHFEKDKLAFSSIEFGSAGRASFKLFLPVYFDKSNALFGLIGLKIDFYRFMELLQYYALNDVGFYLMDKKNRLLYSSEQPFAIAKNKEIYLDKHFSKIKQLIENKNNESSKNNRAIQQIPRFKRQDDKVETLFQIYQSKSFGLGHQFKWIMQSNKNRLIAEIKETEKHSLQISIGLAFIAFALSFIATRKIIKPLLQMIKVIGDEKNELNNLPIQAKDEVGVLARTFYNMKLLKNNKDKQLLEAKNDAERAVLAKSEFFASMSHEIRTPMNGVLGMLGLMMRTNLTKQQKHYATLARSSADSLLVIIDDVLDLSKIEAGKIELESLDFDLREQLGIFAEAMAYRAQDKGLELVLDVTGIEQSMVKGDPGRVRQILSNLVGNAIKFTHQGEISIKATLKRFDEKEWILDCEVGDTGIGVPADKVEKLFDTYSQVDSSTTRKFGGTGLGLAIVKQLTKLMNGNVKASSEFGKGSRFSFNLRLGVSSLSKLVLPQQDIKGKRILVVDDNPTNLEVLVGQLQHWGANIFSATSGQQALDLLEKEYSSKNKSFDIAILDMGMPNMDGAQLGKAIRKNKQYHRLKLVMMTSMASSGDISKFKHIGFSAYFPKPATTHDLFHALQVLVEDGSTLKKLNGMVTNYNISNMTSSNIFSNALVLLAEDNPINQEVALGILNDMGVTVDIAENGIEAIEKLKNRDKNYGLVIMDCQMPKMDGYEASRQIRSKKHSIKDNAIPIIAMTANALKGDREKCLDAGMDDYLTKPVDPNELEDKLRNWLPKEQQDHHIREEPSSLEEEPSSLEEEPSSLEKNQLGNGWNNNMDEDIWDQNALMKRVRNNKKLAEKLISLFSHDLVELNQELQQAVKEQNIELIKNSAHRIKGSAANLSANAVSTIAAEIEKGARNDDLLSVEKNINEFQIQVDWLLQKLNQYKG